MYQSLTFFHSMIRWLVLVSLLYSIFSAYKGYISPLKFTKLDNTVRHWTATFAHIQLVIGIVLYTQSPMFLAIIFITIGSALAKRKQTDKEKFKTMLVWFSTALLIILIAIPWPFSPLANRPYFR